MRRRERQQIARAHLVERSGEEPFEIVLRRRRPYSTTRGLGQPLEVVTRPLLRVRRCRRSDTDNMDDHLGPADRIDERLFWQPARVVHTVGENQYQLPSAAVVSLSERELDGVTECRAT